MALSNERKTVFAKVPEKGPIVIFIDDEDLRVVHGFAQSLYKKVAEELRPGKTSFPMLFAIGPHALKAYLRKPETNILLVKTINIVGFSCSGVLRDAPFAEGIADACDLVPVPGPSGTNYEDFAVLVKSEQWKKEERDWSEAIEANYLVDWDLAIKQNIEFNQFMKDWDEAIKYDKEINEFLSSWSEAIEENQEFDDFVKDWSEAIEINDEFNKFVRDWEEAIEINKGFDKFLKDWDEAIELNHVFDEISISWDEAVEMDTERDFVEAIQMNLEYDWDEAIKIDNLYDWEEAIRLNRLYDEFCSEWDDAIKENEEFDKFMKDWQEAIDMDTGLDWADAIEYNYQYDNAKRVSSEIFSGVLDGSIYSEEFEVLVDEMNTLRVVDLELEEEVPLFSSVVYKQRVRSGNSIYAEGRDLVLFGNLSAGAEVSSDGNVTIIGPAQGRIIAGLKSEDSFVFCSEFYAELISINGKYVSFEQIPEDMNGKAIKFWIEDGNLRYENVSSFIE